MVIAIGGFGQIADFGDDALGELIKNISMTSFLMI